MTELVSVIIPTYNRAELAARAVESVLAQSYAPIETIVVDDGSTDHTVERLRPYGDKVRYIWQQNSGVAAARNTGIRAAAGEFIAFLDSDDQWLPWKLAAQVAAFSLCPELQITYTDAAAVDSSDRVVHSRYLRTYLKSYQYFVDRDLFDRCIAVTSVFQIPDSVVSDARLRVGDFSSALYMGNLILTPTAVFRRRLLDTCGLFDVTVGDVGEDYEFFSRLVQAGAVGLLDLPAAKISIDSGDHLHTQSYKMALANILTMNKMEQRLGSGLRLPPRLVRARRRDSDEWAGLALFDADRFIEARHYLWRAIASGALRPRVIGYWLLSFLPLFAIRATRALYSSLKTPAH